MKICQTAREDSVLCSLAKFYTTQMDKLNCNRCEFKKKKKTMLLGSQMEKAVQSFTSLGEIY